MLFPVPGSTGPFGVERKKGSVSGGKSTLTYSFPAFGLNSGHWPTSKRLPESSGWVPMVSRSQG